MDNRMLDFFFLHDFDLGQRQGRQIFCPVVDAQITQFF